MLCKKEMILEPVRLLLVTVCPWFLLHAGECGHPALSKIQQILLVRDDVTEKRKAQTLGFSCERYWQLGKEDNSIMIVIRFILRRYEVIMGG